MGGAVELRADARAVVSGVIALTAPYFVRFRWLADPLGAALADSGNPLTSN
jgi:hypothetical protein